MKPKEMQFLPDGKTCALAGEESVLDVALKHDVPVPHSCGGMGSCTTCRVIVVKTDDPLPPRNELEQDLADMRDFPDDERLACQLPPTAGLVVRIPVPT